MNFQLVDSNFHGSKRKEFSIHWLCKDQTSIKVVQSRKTEDALLNFLNKKKYEKKRGKSITLKLKFNISFSFERMQTFNLFKITRLSQ